MAYKRPRLDSSLIQLVPQYSPLLLSPVNFFGGVRTMSLGSATVGNSRQTPVTTSQQQTRDGSAQFHRQQKPPATSRHGVGAGRRSGKTLNVPKNAGEAAARSGFTLAESSGWNFADLREGEEGNGSVTGETELDRDYREAHRKVMQVLGEGDVQMNTAAGVSAAEVNASLSTDGQEREKQRFDEAPDLVIGLGQYIYRLREQYQYGILQAIQLMWPQIVEEVNNSDTSGVFTHSSSSTSSPPSLPEECPIKNISQIVLSSAWNSRADLEQMPNGTHKVLGVTLLEEKKDDGGRAGENLMFGGGRGAEQVDFGSAESLDNLLNHDAPGGGAGEATSNSTTTDADLDLLALEEETVAAPRRLRQVLDPAAVRKLSGAVAELICTKRYSPTLSINIQHAVTPKLPKARTLRDPQLKDYLLRLRRLVTNHSVVVFYRDPYQKAKDVFDRNEVTFDPSVDIERPTLEALEEEEKTKLEQERQQWRKFFNYQKIVPLEVDLDRVVIDSLSASKATGYLPGVDHQRLSSSTTTALSTQLLTPAESKSQEIQLKHKLEVEQQTKERSESKMWFEALSAICARGDSSSLELPAIFIRGVYSGTMRQLEYIRRRPALFKSLSSGQSHHIKMKEKKKGMSDLARRGATREQKISPT